jgi:PAS domain-containing protein
MTDRLDVDGANVRDALHALPHAVVVVDRTGGIRFCNESAKRYLPAERGVRSVWRRRG